MLLARFISMIKDVNDIVPTRELVHIVLGFVIAVLHLICTFASEKKP